MKKSERTAARIIEAAVESIVTVGIEKASITDIARRAGVSRALVAHYFPKKAEMFPRLIEHIAQVGYRTIEQPHPELPAAERILFALNANFEFWFRHPGYFKCFILLYYYAAVHADYRATNSRIIERAITRFEELLREDAVARGHFPDEKSADFTEKAALLRRRAESLHRELIGQVEQFFITEPGYGPDEYRARAMATFRRRLEREA
jgi:AcrR family transcriptional regulator